MVEVAWIAGIAAWVATDRRAPASTLAWIVTLAFLPFLGFPIYYLFGPRRLERRRVRYHGLQKTHAAALAAVDAQAAIPDDVRRQVKLAKRLDEAPITTASALLLYRSGAAAFAAIEQEIAEARHHVHVESYIWDADVTGRRLRDLLVERARDGIQVRVLVDGMGAAVRERFFRPLTLAGGQAVRFNPPSLGLRSRLLNFRTHRKIVVVDGRLGFLGGMNVSDAQTVGKGGEKPWRDTQLRIEGQAVRWLQRAFFENWLFASRATLRPSSLYFPELPVGDRWLQIVRSGPDRTVFPIHEFLFAAIAGADERVWITCPYLVPDEAILTALRSAAHRGVDVRLLVPIRGDSRLVAAAVRSYYDDWLDCGARVFEYRPAMLHAKTVVIDRELTIVGSANFDNRSFRLNFEILAAVYGPTLADELAHDFEVDLRRSREVRARQLARRSTSRLLAEAGARLFNALL
jgi:cardiolipin synthase